jgi:hypothetical protein
LIRALDQRALLLQRTGEFEAAAEVCQATLAGARRMGDLFLEVASWSPWLDWSSIRATMT